MARHRRAFARTELVAIVLVLSTVLAVFSIGGHRSRATARRDACSDHLRLLGGALAMYGEAHLVYPPSYVYGSSTAGVSWSFQNQISSNPNPANGYIHWSGILLADGFVAGEENFTCPDVLRGGAPSTNPGPVAANWEPGQMNQLGMTSPSQFPHDRQAARMAYTANAAVLPRNKFWTSPGTRSNLLLGPKQAHPDGSRVGPLDVELPSGTALLTEFLVLPSVGWRTLEVDGVYKSHRPITPFLGISAGLDVYSEPNAGRLPRFTYPSPSAIRPDNLLGTGEIEDQDTIINAVGRHHPGGTANFVFADNSVRPSTPADSVRNRLWGERFYTISGNNRVRPAQ